MKDLKYLVPLLVLFCVWQWLSNKSPDEVKRESDRHSQELDLQRSIVHEVRTLIDTDRSMGTQIGKLRGKALIGDLTGTRDSPSDAQDLLPRSLQASSSDSPITIFMLVNTRHEASGEYEGRHDPAYQTWDDIAVAYWPEKRAGGMVSVAGSAPLSKRAISVSRDFYESEQDKES